MPKLNLDIFSKSDEEHQDEARRPTSEVSKNAEAKSSKKTETPKESPRFVPVGFHVRHLRLLDKAVLHLRERGHWKANKSAIVRLLIEQNAKKLESLYLSDNAEGKPR